MRNRAFSLLLHFSMFWWKYNLYTLVHAYSHLREIKRAAAWKFYFHIKFVLCCVLHLLVKWLNWRFKNPKWMPAMWLDFLCTENVLGHLCRRLHGFHSLCGPFVTLSHFQSKFTFDHSLLHWINSTVCIIQPDTLLCDLFLQWTQDYS